jgi:hypothetical protein
MDNAVDKQSGLNIVVLLKAFHLSLAVVKSLRIRKDYFFLPISYYQVLQRFPHAA